MLPNTHPMCYTGAMGSGQPLLHPAVSCPRAGANSMDSSKQHKPSAGSMTAAWSPSDSMGQQARPYLSSVHSCAQGYNSRRGAPLLAAGPATAAGAAGLSRRDGGQRELLRELLHSHLMYSVPGHALPCTAHTGSLQAWLVSGHGVLVWAPNRSSFKSGSKSNVYPATPACLS